MKKVIAHQSKLKILKPLAQSIYLVVQSDMTSEVRKRSLIETMSHTFEKIRWMSDGGCDCEVKVHLKPMPLDKAIEALSDGHAVYPPEYSMEICAALGIEYPSHLQQHFWSDWTEPKGYHVDPEGEGEIGISVYNLSNWAAAKLGLHPPEKLGRGSQAQANARSIWDYFMVSGKL